MSLNTELSELLKRNNLQVYKNLNTSIPGKITGFDVDTQLAQVQISIYSITTNDENIIPPVIIEAPVVFSGSNNWIVEHEVKAGDECLIVFSQRSIESWIDTGGMAKQSTIRFHDISDAMIIPGLRSQKNKIKNFNNNGISLRNVDGDVYLKINDDGVQIAGGLVVDNIDFKSHVHLSSSPGTPTGPAMISPTSTFGIDYSIFDRPIIRTYSLNLTNSNQQINSDVLKYSTNLSDTGIVANVNGKLLKFSEGEGYDDPIFEIIDNNLFVRKASNTNAEIVLTITELENE